MKVKFWDGSEKIVANRDEAVQVIIDELYKKKEISQRLQWSYSSFFESEFPSIAVIISRDGQVTDEGAIILADIT